MTKKILWATLGLAALSAGHAYATENGNSEYPIGVDTVLPAVMPAEGETRYFDYLNYNDGYLSTGSDGQKAAPNFHVNVVANAFRILHTWNLGSDPWTVTSGGVLPLVDIDGHLGSSLSGREFTFGDIDLQPLYLGWHNQDHSLFVYGGPDVYAPTGHYNSADFINAGENVWTFLPTLGATWKPNKRMDFSVMGNYATSTENSATHYQSGDAVSVTYAADVAPLDSHPNIFVGVQGYSYDQISDDKQYGAVYEDGYRGRASAIGPQFRYDFPGGGFVVKYQHEYDVQNRAKDDRVWLQITFPIFENGRI